MNIMKIIKIVRIRLIGNEIKTMNIICNELNANLCISIRFIHQIHYRYTI